MSDQALVGDAPQHAAPAVEAVAPNRPWILLAALSAAFMAAIESTIVATAMPSIVGALGDFELFTWVFTSYLLTQAATVPIYGRLSDLYGRKRILFIGIGFFLAGSVLCGLAWSMGSLIAFRVLQGIGGGAILPVTQTLIGDLYRGEERARMQGYVSSVFAGAAILGPLVGAFLVAHTRWAMVFWFNVPLGIAAAVMLAVTLRESVHRREHRIDYLGSVLMASGTATLMFALSQATALDLRLLAGLVVLSALLFLVLVLHEQRVQEPMLPLKLWRNRVVAGGNAVNLAIGAVMMGITAFLPAYIQGVIGRDAVTAGLALTALSGSWPVGGVIAGQIMLRTSYRTAAVTGSLLIVIGCAMMAALDPTRGIAWAIGGAAIIGFGMGVTNNCFLVAIQTNTAWTERGAATSSTIFMRIFGQSLGTAVFGGILNISLSSRAAGGDIVNRLMDPVLRRTIPAADVAPITDAFARALHHIYLINAVLAVLIFAAALTLPAGLGLTRTAKRSSPPRAADGQPAHPASCGAAGWPAAISARNVR